MIVARGQMPSPSQGTARTQINHVLPPSRTTGTIKDRSIWRSARNVRYRRSSHGTKPRAVTPAVRAGLH
jgi:hypothetical protein